MVIVATTLGLISVFIIYCSIKIGTDGNWYAEHMAENTPNNDPEK